MLSFSFCNLIGGALLAEPPEVNGLNPPMLPGSFFLHAERGNKLTAGDIKKSLIDWLIDWYTVLYLHVAESFIIKLIRWNQTWGYLAHFYRKKQDMPDFLQLAFCFSYITKLAQNKSLSLKGGATRLYLSWAAKRIFTCSTIVLC